MGLRRGVGPGGRLYCQQAVLLIALEANCQTLDGWGRRGDALRCRSSVCVSRGVNLSLAESVSLQRPATTEEGVLPLKETVLLKKILPEKYLI